MGRGGRPLARTIDATEQGDYRQARSLSEKLLRPAPANQPARLEPVRIRQRFT